MKEIRKPVELKTKSSTVSNTLWEKKAYFGPFFFLSAQHFLLLITMSSYHTDKDTSAPFNGRAADQHLPTQCEHPALLEDAFINSVGKVGL